MKKGRMLIGSVILGLMANALYGSVDIDRIKLLLTNYSYGLRAIGPGSSKFNDLMRDSLAVKLPPESLEQLKRDLITLSRPAATLEGLMNDVRDTEHLLESNIAEISKTAKPEEIESCREKIRRFRVQMADAQRDPRILDLQAKIQQLKRDHRYVELIGSNLDIFGLSKDIVIMQSGPSCSMNNLFNYLRTCLPEELEKIRSKSSTHAQSVLDNVMAHRGNPTALKEVVNGILPNCLWGMALVKIDLIPYDQWCCIERRNPNSKHYRLGFPKVGQIASEFGLTLGIGTVYNPPRCGEDFVFADVERIVRGIPDGAYAISSPCHYVFLKKIAGDVRCYNSGAGHSGILGEVFSFSFHNDDAIRHLVEVANYDMYAGMCPRPGGGRLEFHQLTVNP